MIMTMQLWIAQARRESVTPEQKRKMAEADAKWYLANISKVKELQRAYYENNRAKIFARRKALSESRRLARPRKNG